VTRLLEGLTFTETEQVAENQLGVDAMELLKQQKKEIEDMKRSTEEQKKRIAELEAKTTGTNEVCFPFLFFFSFSDFILLPHDVHRLLKSGALMR